MSVSLILPARAASGVLLSLLLPELLMLLIHGVKTSYLVLAEKGFDSVIE